MSFWDSAEQQDYEEPDTTIYYTLSFNDGQDAVQLNVTHPGSSDELDFELADPELVAALHAACQAVVEKHFQAEADRELCEDEAVRQRAAGEITESWEE